MEEAGFLQPSQCLDCWNTRVGCYKETGSSQILDQNQKIRGYANPISNVSTAEPPFSEEAMQEHKHHHG